MKIILFGIYPPPYGGISIHLKRVKLSLEKSKNEVLLYNEGDFENKGEKIYNGKSKKKIFKIPFIQGDVFHFHTLSKKMRSLLFFYKLFNKKIMLTIHGESLKNQLDNSNFLTKKLLATSLKHLDKIICVNPKTVKELTALGIENKKVYHIPAYINPIEHIEDVENIPKKVWKFIEESEFLISANGTVRFYKGEDLYGIDMLIELMRELKVRKENIKLLFCMLSVETQNTEEKKYYEELKVKITELGLQDKIMLYEVQNTEFYPILRKSNLFIRPTNTDGYGVSVAEAIYYDVPAIASDVCNRTEGTILFKSRGIVDLTEKTNYIIDNYSKEKERIKKIEVKDYFNELYKVYKELSRRKR